MPLNTCSNGASAVSGSIMRIHSLLNRAFMRIFVKSQNLTLLLIFFLLPSLAFPREANISKRSPDQVLVVFNANSPVSCAIANDYARKRNVKNMLSIQCQDSALNTKNETITWAAYTQ